MADEGATPRELLLESCRRNNTDLLQSLISSFPHGRSSSSTSSDAKPPQLLTDVLNNSTDGVGNHALHVAASCGAYEVLDLLLDQEGLEVDPLDRLERDTPLHKAVRWVNGLGGPGAGAGEDAERGRAVVEILVDAGCDPRIRNKARLRPVDLVDPRDAELRAFLQKAEYSFQVSDDVVREEDDGPTGSASDED